MWYFHCISIIGEVGISWVMSLCLVPFLYSGGFQIPKDKGKTSMASLHAITWLIWNNLSISVSVIKWRLCFNITVIIYWMLLLCTNGLILNGKKAVARQASFLTIQTSADCSCWVHQLMLKGVWIVVPFCVWYFMHFSFQCFYGSPMVFYLIVTIGLFCVPGRFFIPVCEVALF